MNKLILITVLYLLVPIKTAYAYIDPGTGSIILQAIIGFVAAALTAIKLYWEKVKYFLKKIFKINKK